MNRFQKFLKLDARLKWLKETYPWQFNALAFVLGLIVVGIVLLILFLLRRV